MSQKREEYINSPHLYDDPHRSKAFCLDSKCAYYYEEIDECMCGEPEIPDYWERKCEKDGK